MKNSDSPDPDPTSRRDFIGRVALSAVAISMPSGLQGSRLNSHASDAQPQVRGFQNLLRGPDNVVAQSAAGDVQLTRDSNGRWINGGTIVATTANGGALRVTLSSPAAAIKRVHLRWRGNISTAKLILGDAWERAYGDLEWRGWAPDRVMPWYAATNDGTVTHAYGVRTGANAFCFWQIDPQGISLWADVRSGAMGVQLGERTLDVCDVVCRAGKAEESAFGAVHAFCKQMCSNPRLPSAPVYGSNDWYWAYGKNSADSVRTDVNHIVELSPTGSNRPFAVIDDGWQPERSKDKLGVGTWDHGNEKFGDMAALASDIKKAGARGGVWIRPLQATRETADTWRLPRNKNFLDPSVPEVRQKIAEDISRLRAWGYEMIKHDYTTFDLFGQWGFQMGAGMTRDGWTFATGSSRTTAEIVNELYSTIRTAAGDSLVIGCNTVSHLSAGQFEICRIGDDTSGTEWNRVRKMGVNSLAFRGVHHGAFYVADADCIGVTTAIPWSLNKQWLDVLARSGTMTFVSLAPDALGTEQRRDLKTALALAAAPQPLGEPLDWQHNVYPSRWKMTGAERTFDWVGADGAGMP
ncbi:MAG: hypothetical protein ABJB66_01385 [Gemmatimonadaceae bacterium]